MTHAGNTRQAPHTPVELTPEQARYLSTLTAEDLRTDEQHGRTPATSPVLRDIHYPAWQALQPACHWDTQPPDTIP